MAGKPISGGLETAPPVFEKPLWRDSFFWITMATIAFWVAVIWYFFL